MARTIHSRHSRRDRHPPVQSVTTAPESLRDEQAARIRRYLVTMGIRTVCFVLAAVTATLGMAWWVWGLFAVLAVVLPYIAVVLANAVRARPDGGYQAVTPTTDHPREIER